MARTPAPQPARRGRIGTVVAWSVLAAAALGAGIGLQVWRGRGGPPATGTIVAEVNGSPITTRHVDVEFAVQKDLQLRLAGKVLDATPAATAAFRRDLVDRLVDRWLVLDAAAKAGIAVSDADAAGAVDAVDARFGLPTGTVRQAIVGSPYGLTDADVDTWARQQMLADAYVRRPESQSIVQQWVSEHGPVQDQVTPVALALYPTADVKLHLDGAVVAPVREGQPAPELVLPTPDGGTLRLSEFRGKAVMVNFWATWCAPCRAEIPLFINAANKNSDRLVILGVDSQEPVDLVKRFASDIRINYPLVIDTDGKASAVYRVKALPTTFFVDAEGIVVKAVRGTIHNRLELNGYLEQIMDAPQSAAPDLLDRLALLR